MQESQQTGLDVRCIHLMADGRRACISALGARSTSGFAIFLLNTPSSTAGDDLRIQSRYPDSVRRSRHLRGACNVVARLTLVYQPPLNHKAIGLRSTLLVIFRPPSLGHISSFGQMLRWIHAAMNAKVTSRTWSTVMGMIRAVLGEIPTLLRIGSPIICLAC